MISQVTREEVGRFTASAKVAKVRSMREFAESEIIIPDGPYASRRLKCSRQPYTGLWFDAIDSGKWNRFCATGPTQSGKSLSCFLIPMLYHLFEMGETVICGVPDMDIAQDKWLEDILPIIEKSRYKDLLPTKGGGSRGGKVDAIRFLNGTTLKFMSGGGGDKSRSAFTSRVLVITETDGMDESGGSSRESDKITQLEARTRAYGSRKRIYFECTVSTQSGRTWQEYQNGTRSSILLRCPLCKSWVEPERSDLIGWKDAESQVAAREKAGFQCPECSKVWTEDNRVEANRESRLVHNGQSIEDSGAIVGEEVRTDTLGYRWSAVNNLFLTTADIAADEWRASRSADEDNAEKEMRQFVWTLPVLPPQWEETAIVAEEITRRLSVYPRGVIPPGTQYLSSAIDLGKYLCHWVVVAWDNRTSSQVVDYGRIEVASADLGVERALAIALQEYEENIREGYPVGVDPDDPTRVEGVMLPSQAWIDSGYMSEVVYNFCRKSGPLSPFIPAVGRGTTQLKNQNYRRPAATGAVVKRIGEEYHTTYLKESGVHLVIANADYWKSIAHQRLTTPLSEAGAMSLYQAPAHEHLSLAKHLTAEKKTEEFVSKKGIVDKWVRVRRNNHWFDALYNACAAGHAAGVRRIGEVKKERPRKKYGVLSKK